MPSAGSAAFGARWKTKEAKLVECPALSDSMPEYRTTYDVEPHAELLGFDDAKWAEVAATDLGAVTGILGATPQGRALYEALGWAVAGPLSSFVYQRPTHRDPRATRA